MLLLRTWCTSAMLSIFTVIIEVITISTNQVETAQSRWPRLEVQNSQTNPHYRY